jgi:hypothetical protein
MVFQRGLVLVRDRYDVWVGLSREMLDCSPGRPASPNWYRLSGLFWAWNTARLVTANSTGLLWIIPLLLESSLRNRSSVCIYMCVLLDFP